MVVTLDVSKLSGWLNADAYCRESNGGHTVWCEVQSTGSGRRRRATAVHAACRGELDYRLGSGLGKERTLNMLAMVVTLEVSKLSGWLNDDAPCQESNGGHTVRDNVRPGRRAGGWRATAVQAGRRGEGSTADWGQGTGRSAHRTCITCS